MAISAQDVKALREQTGAGMMDCKRALTESNGDMQKALEYLQKKNLAALTKREGKIAAEGAVDIEIENNVGALVEMNSETDFVGNSPAFRGLLKEITKHIVTANPANVADLLQQAYTQDGTIDGHIKAVASNIKEKIVVRRFVRFVGSANTLVGSYIHGGGRIGVMLELAAGSEEAAKSEAFAALLKDIAMQSAAASPTKALYVDDSEIPEDVIAKEREICAAQMEDSGKSEKILQGIIAGKIQAWKKQVCLIEQPFIREPKMSVKDHMKAVAKELGTTISIKNIARFELGEGIEKAQDDFAAEVAKQMKG